MTTTLIDVYEAAGGTVNEDRTMVTMDEGGKPFKIELTVAMTGMEQSVDGTTVTFGVLLDRKHVIEGVA